MNVPERVGKRKRRMQDVQHIAIQKVQTTAKSISIMTMMMYCTSGCVGVGAEELRAEEGSNTEVKWQSRAKRSGAGRVLCCGIQHVCHICSHNNNSSGILLKCNRFSCCSCTSCCCRNCCCCCWQLNYCRLNNFRSYIFQLSAKKLRHATRVEI